MNDKSTYLKLPPTAHALDDTLSCKELDNGNFMMCVHISDVSYFLKDVCMYVYTLNYLKTLCQTLVFVLLIHMKPQKYE
jgi:hypothetical protein